MSLEDECKLYIEAYYGILEMDEYELNLYIAKNIEKIINNFVEEYKIKDYAKINEYVKKEVSIKTKLQSSLIVLNQIKGPIELILLIKEKLKKIK